MFSIHLIFLCLCHQSLLRYFCGRIGQDLPGYPRFEWLTSRYAMRPIFLEIKHNDDINFNNKILIKLEVEFLMVFFPLTSCPWREGLLDRALTWISDLKNSRCYDFLSFLKCMYSNFTFHNLKDLSVVMNFIR